MEIDQQNELDQLVVLQSAHQRYLVIQGLINLKGNEVYEGISVTEDFTLFERSQIKEWSKKAQERNAKESDDSTFIWRVRGSPSRGLYLKRTEKKVAINSQNHSVFLHILINKNFLSKTRLSYEEYHLFNHKEFVQKNCNGWLNIIHLFSDM